MSVSKAENGDRPAIRSASHKSVSQPVSQPDSSQSVCQYDTFMQEAGSSYLVGRTQIDIQPLWLHTSLHSRHRRLPSRRSASNRHVEVSDIPSAVSEKFSSQCNAQLMAVVSRLCPKTRNFCPRDIGFSFCTRI